MPELRVHGGLDRGRRLRTPKGIRPTKGIVKEAIFNVLGPAVAGAVVVDLCAGSGALGIEALSRGAAAVTFVERELPVAAILRQNLEALGYLDRAQIVRADAVRWLVSNRPQVAAAQVFLLDPPYTDGDLLGQALAELDGGTGPGAAVVAEHPRGSRLPELARLLPVRQKNYGDTTVTVLRVAP